MIRWPGGAAAPETRLLTWMCVLVCVNQLGFGILVPSLPLYAKEFGVPVSAIGLAVAAYGLTRMLFGGIAGYLADRLGRRATLAIGGIVAAVGSFWCAVAHSYPEFIVARLVAGAGPGMVLTAGQIVLTDFSPPERRGRTLSTYMTAFLFGLSIGPLPGGLLAAHLGLAAPLVAAGVASLIAAALGWFTITETRGMRPESRRQPDTPAKPYLKQAAHLFSDLGFALVTLISLMNAFVRTGGLFLLIPLLGATKLHLGPDAVGFAMMIGSVAGLFAGYPGGWLTDRFGRKAVIVPATVLTGLSMLLYCIAPNMLAFSAAAFVWGIASSIGSAAPAAYAADKAPAGMNAVAMSTYRMTADIGYVTGPLLLGAIADHLGATVAIMLASAGLVASGLAFAIVAPETHGARAVVRERAT